MIGELGFNRSSVHVTVEGQGLGDRTPTILAFGCDGECLFLRQSHIDRWVAFEAFVQQPTPQLVIYYVSLSGEERSCILEGLDAIRGMDDLLEAFDMCEIRPWAPAEWGPEVEARYTYDENTEDWVEVEPSAPEGEEDGDQGDSAGSTTC